MKNLRALLVTTGIVLAVTSPAMANGIQVGFSGSSYGPYQTGQGGEFTLNDVTPDNWLDLSGYVDGVTKNLGASGNPITSFQTFCIEATEHIGGYSSTYNAQLNTNALWGSTGSSTGDPVSKGTGWLYSQFATTSWDGTYGLSYDYGAGRSSGSPNSANALQQAFWWLEGESVAYNASNIYMLAAVNRFGSEANAMQDGAAQFGVSAVNLWTGNDPNQNRAQDQLYYNLEATTRTVPDGGTTLTLLGLAMGGLAIASRRLRRR